MKYHSYQVYVKESPGKGLGVFSIVKCEKGHVLECAPVLVLNTSDTSQALDMSLSSYIYRLSRYRCLIGLGYCSLYNHSSEPNIEFYVEENCIRMQAIRPIYKDQELLIDYCWSKEEYRLAGFKQ